MSGKIAIPTDLPENVQDWKGSEVLEFLNNNRIQYDLDNEDIQVIGNNKVAGVALLALTEEKLRSIGLTFGPAAAIALIIEELKRAKGLATAGLLSLEEYLSCAPPHLAYSPHGTTSTSSTNAIGNPPDEVMIWEDFLESVNNYTFDQEQKKYAKPNFIENFITTNEEVVRRAMD
ncbi:10303_t:CDS:2, partial [Paraglomus occultum]